MYTRIINQIIYVFYCPCLYVELCRYNVALQIYKIVHEDMHIHRYRLNDEVLFHIKSDQ